MDAHLGGFAEAYDLSVIQVVQLLAAEKGWSWSRRRTEQKRAEEFLDTFYAAVAPPPTPSAA